MVDNRIVASTYLWIFLLPALMTFSEKFPLEYGIFPFNATEPLRLQLDIPFNWYLAYFSAVCFGAARIIYLIKCPEFLRHYSTASEANSDGVTMEIVKDYCTNYLTKFQNKEIHPLSEEGTALQRLLHEFVGPNEIVKQKYLHENSANFDEYVAGSHVMEIENTGLYTIGFTEENFDNRLKRKSKNLPIWRLIELQDVSHTGARITMTVLVALGFLLFIVPLLQGFSAVLFSYIAS